MSVGLAFSKFGLSALRGNKNNDVCQQSSRSEEKKLLLETSMMNQSKHYLRRNRNFNIKTCQEQYHYLAFLDCRDSVSEK